GRRGADLAGLGELLLEVGELPVLEFEQPLQVAYVLLEFVDARLRLAQRVVTRDARLGGVGCLRTGSRTGHPGARHAAREPELVAGGRRRGGLLRLADCATRLLPALLATDFARVAREPVAVLVERLQARAHLGGHLGRGERTHFAFARDAERLAGAHLVHPAEEGIRIGPVDRDDRLVERDARRTEPIGNRGQGVAALDGNRRGSGRGGC